MSNEPAEDDKEPVSAQSERRGAESSTSRWIWICLAVLGALLAGVSASFVTFVITNGDDSVDESPRALTPDPADPETATSQELPASPSVVPAPTTEPAPTAPPTLPLSVTANDGLLEQAELDAVAIAAVSLGVTIGDSLDFPYLAAFNGDTVCDNPDGFVFTNVDEQFRYFVDMYERVGSSDQQAPWESAWTQLALASFMCRDDWSGIETLLGQLP